jgi:hypothetical protein
MPTHADDYSRVGSLGELATPIYQGGPICVSRGKTASLALCTKSRVDSHDSAATQRRFVSAEINISRVDSHDKMCRRFAPAA